MGFLDAQLAQGYAFNFAMKAGLLTHEDAEAINDIQNGLSIAEKLMGLGMETSKVQRPRMAQPGEYRSDEGSQMRGRIASSQRSAGNFKIKPRFRANRTMSRERRYRRDNNIRHNRKIPSKVLDNWEIRSASKGMRGRIIRRIVAKRLFKAFAVGVPGGRWHISVGDIIDVVSIGRDIYNATRQPPSGRRR